MVVILKLCIFIIVLYREVYSMVLEKEIWLISSNNDRQQYKNYLLQNVLERMGFLVISHDVEISDFSTTIRFSEEYPNLINLDAISNVQGSIMFQNSNSNLFVIEDTNSISSYYDTPRILISEDLIRNNAVRSLLDSDNFEIPDKVLLCFPNNLPELQYAKNKLSDEFRNMHLMFVDDCNNVSISNSVMAILSDSPFHSETRIPVIFYHTPYFVEEVKDNFPNSVFLWWGWKPLKNAFKYFLNDMNWKRVAILSDDSDYSLDFLQELLPLLDMEQFVYSSQVCRKIFCDFSDALQKLVNAEARIVILNVETIHAEKLVQQISYYALRHVTWVVRDWPFPRNIKFQGMAEMFSITLSPKFMKGSQTVENKVYMNSIRKGLRLIYDTYTNVLGDRERFQRKILKQHTRNFHIRAYYAYITRVDSSGHFTGAATVRIDGAQVHLELKYSPSNVKPDFPDRCLVRNNDYFNPCGEEEILWMLAVVIMFTFIFLVIVVFFTRYQEVPYQRIF